MAKRDMEKEPAKHSLTKHSLNGKETVERQQMPNEQSIIKLLAFLFVWNWKGTSIIQVSAAFLCSSFWEMHTTGCKLFSMLGNRVAEFHHKWFAYLTNR